MKSVLTGTIVATALSAALTASAGPDENQRMLTQQLMQSKQKVK